MRTVETKIHVAVRPETALQAFLQLDAMQKWWGVERGLVEAREGGVWALAWERSEHGFKYVITGRIASLLPGRQLLISEMLYFNPDRPVLGPMSLMIAAARPTAVASSSFARTGTPKAPIGTGITRS